MKGLLRILRVHPLWGPHVIMMIRLHAHRGLLVEDNPVISSEGESCAIQVL